MTYVVKSPALVVQGTGNQGIATWYHSSADAGSAVDADGFVTDGVELGMKVGDLFVHRDTGTDVVTTHAVKTLNANGSVDLTDTTTTATGTDSD